MLFSVQFVIVATAESIHVHKIYMYLYILKLIFNLLLPCSIYYGHVFVRKLEALSLINRYYMSLYHVHLCGLATGETNELYFTN